MVAVVAMHLSDNLVSNSQKVLVSNGIFVKIICNECGAVGILPRRPVLT